MGMLASCMSTHDAGHTWSHVCRSSTRCCWCPTSHGERSCTESVVLVTQAVEICMRQLEAVTRDGDHDETPMQTPWQIQLVLTPTHPTLLPLSMHMHITGSTPTGATISTLAMWQGMRCSSPRLRHAAPR